MAAGPGPPKNAIVPLGLARPRHRRLAARRVRGCRRHTPRTNRAVRLSRRTMGQNPPGRSGRWGGFDLTGRGNRPSRRCSLAFRSWDGGKVKDQAHLQEQAAASRGSGNTAAKRPQGPAVQVLATGCLRGRARWLATAEKHRDAVSAVGPTLCITSDPANRRQDGGPSGLADWERIPMGLSHQTKQPA